MIAAPPESAADSSRQATEVDQADVVVVGAGPAGIAAAARAAEAGRRVVLLDAAPNVGGQIWRHRSRSQLTMDARRWMHRLDRTNAQVRRGVAVVDVVVDSDRTRFTVVTERHSDAAAALVRAPALVIASGARERFLPFPGWTLSGVYGIGGAQALLKQGTAFRGKRVVIAGTGPLMLPVAASLANAGARLELVAEQASFAAVRNFALSLVSQPGTLVQAATYRLGFLRTAYATGTWVASAGGTDRLTSVTVSDGRSARTIACDVLCTGYGLVPNGELGRLLGCAMIDGAIGVDERQRTSIAGVFAAGEVTGVGGMELAVVEGELAGAAAAGASRLDGALLRRRSVLRDAAARLERTFAPRAELRALARADTIVCRCEDVRRATVEPLRDARQAKLYARAGMGACQGRVCGPALEFLFGWQPGSVRAPVEPARVSTLAVVGEAVANAAAARGTTKSSSGS